MFKYMTMQPSLPPHPNTLRHLLTLPIDILTLILSNLDRTSLTRILRANRYLNSAATPLLYRTVILDPDTGINPTTGTIDCEPGLAFVKTLTEKPELCEYVHELTVHDHHSVDTNYADSLEKVIAQMRNLRHLVIKGCYAPTAEFQIAPVLAGSLERVYAGALSGLSLSNLQRCSLSMSLGPPWSLPAYEAIFLSPTLKQLTLHNAAIPDFAAHNTNGVTISHSTPLESLTLLCCDISASKLAKILAIPRALTHLSLSGPRQYGLPEYMDSQHNLYLQAMTPQIHSLRKLELGLWRLRTRDIIPLDFTHLRVLEDLTFTPFVIRVRGYPYNLTPLATSIENPSPFPASLRYLTVFHIFPGTVIDTENMFMVALAQLLRGARLPNLQRVTFDTPDSLCFRREYPLLFPLGWDAIFRIQNRDPVLIQRTRCELRRSFGECSGLGNCACCDYNFARVVFYK
ncbi:hypothetical protein BDW66DRAFT_148707 [Aspergillus desertorum]